MGVGHSIRYKSLLCGGGAVGCWLLGGRGVGRGLPLDLVALCFQDVNRTHARTHTHTHTTYTHTNIHHQNKPQTYTHTNIHHQNKPQTYTHTNIHHQNKPQTYTHTNIHHQNKPTPTYTGTFGGRGGVLKRRKPYQLNGRTVLLTVYVCPFRVSGFTVYVSSFSLSLSVLSFAIKRCPLPSSVQCCQQVMPSVFFDARVCEVLRHCRGVCEVLRHL